MNTNIDENEKTRIEKKRNTTIKIVVSKKVHSDEGSERKYLAELFGFPEYTIQESKTNNQLVYTLKESGHVDSVWVSESIVSLLAAFGIDESIMKTNQCYQEKTDVYYTTSSGKLIDHVRETLGLNHNTSIRFAGTNYEYNEDDPVYFYEILMSTAGESKTTIAKEHKENVSKLLHYLRLHGAMLNYGCNWWFEGNKTCTI